MKDLMRQTALKAKESRTALSVLSAKDKNKALVAMAKALLAHEREILAANVKDIQKFKQKSVEMSLLNRLALDSFKLKKMADSIRLIASLPDPVGNLISMVKRPNGIVIKKVRVPIGTILIIYESRPNVTADCMALCLKSGNSVILKGGSESLESNAAIFSVLKAAAKKCGIPDGAFQFVNTSDREAVKQLLTMSDLIDLVIPRGGESLIRHVAEASKIPVIKHYKGVCHVYVDKDADLTQSVAVAVNAKAQNPAVCNAMETLLVHEKVASKFLPVVARAMKDKDVELRGDDKTFKLVPGIQRATEEDWHAEYLDLILSIRVVKDVDEAIAHIQKYGSNHSDAIITKNNKTAKHFTDRIDSACVFVNCSTRFNDGGEFGMGAEMGISTDKLHARGPMGLEELTSYKYLVLGKGQTRH